MSMWDKLMGGSTAPAPPPERQVYSKEREAQARANGFNSAEEMMAWAKQRNTKTGGTSSGSSRPSLEAASMIHPKNILNWVMERYANATGQ